MIIRGAVCMLFVVFVLVWFYEEKAEPLSRYIEIELAQVGNVAGCEKEFEGTFIAWPEPPENDKCYRGYKLREFADGERISKIEEKFRIMQYQDMAKLAVLALLASLLIHLLVRLGSGFMKTMKAHPRG